MPIHHGVILLKQISTNCRILPEIEDLVQIIFLWHINFESDSILETLKAP